MKTKTFILSIVLAISTSLIGQNIVQTFDAHSGKINEIKVSPNGERIITTGVDARTNLWNAGDNKRLKIFKGFSNDVSAACFDNTARFFITEGSNGKLVLWDMFDYKPIVLFDCKGETVTNLVSDPFNKFIAGSTNSEILIWDYDGKSIKTFQGMENKVEKIAFSPDGKYFFMASSNDVITIYNTNVWEKKNQVQLKLKGITGLTINPNGKTYAVAGNNGFIYVCKIQNQEVIKQEKIAKQGLTNISFAKDGKTLILSTANELFDFNVSDGTKEQLYTNQEKTIANFAINDQTGLVYAAFTNGQISVLEFQKLKDISPVMVERNGSVLLALSDEKISDKNENGLLEQNEQGTLTFNVENVGESPVYDATIKLSLTNEISGLDIPLNYYLGNIDVGQKQQIKIALTGTESLESATSSIIMRVFENDKILNTPLMADFTTRGADIPSYLIVEDYMLTTPTGKLELGIPVTLRLLVRNITDFTSGKAEIKYKFPKGIVALNKLIEDLSGIKPNETRELSVQFMPEKGFADTSINIDFEISGLAYSNIDDINFSLIVDSEVTKQETGELAFVQKDTEKATYRGGGDPLMGLNVSYSEDDLTVGDYYALIIGVDNYEGTWQPLNNAVSDAKALEQVLKEKYTFSKVTSLFNENATRENIIGEFEKLVNNVSQSDNVLIYYSGHGEFNDALRKGFWVPSDAKTNSTANYISNSDIQTYLGGIKSRHTLLISDACFSGDIFRGNVVTVPFEESIKYYSKVYNIASRKAITSGGIEPVLDGGKDGHSVFAYYLLKALQNNNEKYLDASQLYESVKIPVINNSEQTPRYNPIKNTGDEGGQFIFINK